MRTFVDRFRKNVCHRRWIQRPGTILALLLIVLTFFAEWYSRGEVRKCDLIVFNSTSTHYCAYRKYTEWIPPYSGYAAAVLSTVFGNELLRTITSKCLFCYCISITVKTGGIFNPFWLPRFHTFFHMIGQFH